MWQLVIRIYIKHILRRNNATCWEHNSFSPLVSSDHVALFLHSQSVCTCTGNGHLNTHLPDEHTTRLHTHTHTKPHPAKPSYNNLHKHKTVCLSVCLGRGILLSVSPLLPSALFKVQGLVSPWQQQSHQEQEEVGGGERCWAGRDGGDMKRGQGVNGDGVYMWRVVCGGPSGHGWCRAHRVETSVHRDGGKGMRAGRGFFFSTCVRDGVVKQVCVFPNSLSGDLHREPRCNLDAWWKMTSHCTTHTHSSLFGGPVSVFV